MNAALEREFSAIDREIAELKQALRAQGQLALEDILTKGMDLVTRLMVAYGESEGKTMPQDQDPLVVFRASSRAIPALTRCATTCASRPVTATPWTSTTGMPCALPLSRCFGPWRAS
jgi:hypothetical protein